MKRTRRSDGDDLERSQQTHMISDLGASFGAPGRAWPMSKSREIRDAFRAAGYSPQEVDGFATVIESRIAALNKL